MIVVNGKDFMEVRTASLIADYDRDILCNLYQPIIGFTGFAVYLSLLSESKNQRTMSIINHEEFFDRMKITAAQFVDARKLLEGIGLVKTYVAETSGVKIFHYDIFAPRNPKEFFDNTLLYGMFIKAVGEMQANKIKNVYKIEVSQNNGEDITSSFIEAYRPDFDDPAFAKAMNNSSVMVARSGAKIACEFSYEKFFNRLQVISQINPNSFSKKDMKEIERISTLLGASEENAADVVANIYNPHTEKNRHIDFTEFSNALKDRTSLTLHSTPKDNKKNVVRGESDLIRKIALMEETSPREFLSVLQNYSVPAASDLAILDQLSSNFRLKNGVINALVDYVLTTNDNLLSKFACEKIAAALAREHIQNATDAMNYLNKIRKSRTKGKSDENKIVLKPKTNEIKEVKQKKKEKDDSLDWNSLIDALDEGDSDGKA